MAVPTRDEWHDPAFTARWDSDPGSRFNVRDEQLDIIVSIVADGYRDGAAILDVGSGSGLVEEVVFQRIPNARVVGIDDSEPMIEMADKRLRPYKDRYTIVKHDLADLSTIELPNERFQYVVTSQVIHELPHDTKRDVFKLAHTVLEDSGTFLITDRIRMQPGLLMQPYGAMWSRWAEQAPNNEDATFAEFFQGYQDKQDYTATLDETLGWLEQAGFDAAPLHLHLNRFIIGAQKRAWVRGDET